MQVLNVALGGTLVQDIPTMVNGALHPRWPSRGIHIAHEVWVANGSRLYQLMKDILEGDSCR